jgi:acyl carrier protein
MTTTFEKICAIIVRDFDLPPERLQRDTLLEEIELDSLSITELVFSIEDEFQITAESSIPPFKTLGDIADYVARLIAERDAKPRAAAKPAAAPAISAQAVKPATPKRPRSGAKKVAPSVNGAPKPRTAANGAKPSKQAGGARNSNGEAHKRANGESHTNGTLGGSARHTKPARGAKRPSRPAPGDDAQPRKTKRSGAGRVVTRER